MSLTVNPEERLAGWFERRDWGKGDLAALMVWTAAVVCMFWSAVSFRGALFYFDISEINYPYRAFFAEELRAGRFSRWCPSLYCGMPLFSESQAGYLHPLKYLLYPWLQTWQAFNLDTVLSIWLAGLGTHGWLRRHVGPGGALTGAAIFGLGGFTWAHLVHTSMINALASVPFAVWALEWSWESGRWRGCVLGAIALACQVFAGHLQDVMFCAGLLGFYGLYRTATEKGKHSRSVALGMAAVTIALGIVLSAVQWIPSKELLDRSPRANGLTWEELTYGSWSPELIPTLVVREAYGTRARDTDWMDGFYPYHEMNAYLGLIALGLAVVGAGGVGLRDRWTNFWVIVAVTGFLLMLGRFTFLFDFAHRLPILGSSREPVRFHVWVSLAVAALAAVGVERLGNSAGVRIRGGVLLSLALIAVSIPILAYVYAPVWTMPRRWNQNYHVLRYRWLGMELTAAAIRTSILACLGWGAAWWASRTSMTRRRARIAAILPVLVLADLMGAHWSDAPTVSPSYWVDPPETARRLLEDPGFVRVFGKGDKSAGEPGYASETIDFMSNREPLDWSLPAAWGLAGAKGETPMIARRLLDYFDNTKRGAGRFDLESVTHIVTGRALHGTFAPMPSEPVGSAFIHRNPRALPRSRLVGRPVYTRDQNDSIEAVRRLGPGLYDHLVVEDPEKPMPADAAVSGSARIVRDQPEHVVVETESAGPAYLVLADTFDPGWSATLDGQPVEIRPAYIAFRAVYLPEGKHTVVFRYRPAGFEPGLALSTFGALAGLFLFLRPGQSVGSTDHATMDHALRWRRWWLVAVVAIILGSTIRPGLEKSLSVQSRWSTGFHRFTWGAGIEAMRSHRQ